MQIFGLVLVLVCLPSALINFALGEWKKTPQLRMEDAYKWLYQATRGGEHAIPDKSMARDWLEKEWQTLGKPIKNEPLWQPLCLNGEIGRLNLRPFRARGGQMNDILEAFIQSSRDFKNDEANFIAAWNELGKRLEYKSYGNLTLYDWKELNQKMKAHNYPAIHHSEIYEQNYQPAYRILTGNNFHKLINLKAKT